MPRFFGLLAQAEAGYTNAQYRLVSFPRRKSVSR
jgi:hypothetical protein